MISETAIVADNAVLGENVKVGDYVVIGLGGGVTEIGDNSVIRSHTVIYGGNKIGKNFQTGHGVLVREDNVIGDDVSLGSHSDIEHDVVVEDGVRVHSNVFIPEHSILRRGAWIGPCTCLTNARYPKSPDEKMRLKGPEVGEDAVVGANVTVMPGVRIGRGSLVGAGAVLLSDVEEDSVVVGVPGRKVRKRSEIKEYR